MPGTGNDLEVGNHRTINDSPSIKCEDSHRLTRSNLRD